MTVVLPVAAGALLVALFAGTAGDVRRALLKGTVAWGVAVVSITEILSRIHAFTFVGVLIAWALILAGIATYVILARGIRSLRPHILWPDHSRPAWIAVGVILLIVAVVALFAPPNNWDSMTYHMARVEHWIQNRTVDPYPTNILRQIYPSPWAEWAIAHFQLLAGSDRFANLIQWLALAGLVAAAPLLADQLGAGSRGRWFAAVLCVTMPMAILQGSSTQNDLVASFWLVASAHFALRFADGPSWREGGWAGAALGLAALTKGTGILFGIPIVVLMTGAALHRVGWRALGPLAVALALAVGLNAGHLVRNVATFGNAAGPPGEMTRHGNESHTPGATLSNVIRNAALHLATPRVSWNHKVVAGVGALHRVLGLDVDDPRTTWGAEQFHLTRKIIHEDHAPQPLHAALFAFIVGAVLLIRRLRSDRTLLLWTLGLAAGWVLFSFAVK
ncbi:MAG TPA: glycosyltransferase family 39 protein, partial [Planctomycetota bacterium]|nr:glycosyltransferase family 39 protein [Planctomycetota bacterium]